MLPSHISNVRVYTVVADSDDAGRVTEERTATGDGVEDGVETKLRWLTGRSSKTFL
jgi:hypothetical protein